MAGRKEYKGIGGKKTGLVSVGDIANMLDIASNTVSKWVLRHDDFPKPKGRTTAGKLYNKEEVIKWLKRTNRM